MSAHVVVFIETQCFTYAIKFESPMLYGSRLVIVVKVLDKNEVIDGL